MTPRSGLIGRLGLALGPFTVLALLHLAGAEGDTLSGSFLTACFLFYLAIPALARDRRRLLLR
jgi:hypothetical protein